MSNTSDNIIRLSLQPDDDAGAGWRQRAKRPLSPEIAEGLARMARNQAESGFDPAALGLGIVREYKAKQAALDAGQGPEPAPAPITDDEITRLLLNSPYPALRRMGMSDAGARRQRT
jgi:hypothetical protein